VPNSNPMRMNRLFLKPRHDENMARLDADLKQIRQRCDADRGGYPKPVLCVSQRKPLHELAELRRGVSNLVLRALVAGVSPTDVLVNVGIAIDAAAQLAALPIEKFNAR
jgi:hypothetical protein